MTIEDQQRDIIFAALDNAPMTWRHYALWFVASGGALIDGYSVAGLGVALPLMKRELSIDPAFVGLIGSALVLGAVAGAALGGAGADRFGRKRVFLVDMTLIAFACVAAAAAPNAWFVLLAQFLLGVGVGIDFPTSASYVSEFMPKRTRSRMTIATIAMQSVGMVCAALAGLAILRVHPSTGDWRLMLGAGGGVALIFIILRAFAPESARWLSAKGRFEEAKALLERLSIEFGEAPQAPAAPLRVFAAQAPHTPRSSAPVGYTALFGASYRARTLLASLPWMLMDVATYGVGLFTPVILDAMRFGDTRDGPIAATFADAEGSAFVDLFLLFGFFASLVATPRFGRIPMQVAGFAGMTLGMLLLLFAALALDGPARHMGAVIGGFTLFNFAMNAGPNATTFALAPALFPTNIRATASGFAAASAKVGAVFGTFVAPQLQAAWGLAGVVALMVTVSAAGLVATAALAHVVNEEGALTE